MPGRSSLRPYLARTGIEVIICTAAVHGCAELRRLSSVAQAVVKQPRVQAEQWAPTATGLYLSTLATDSAYVLGSPG